MVQNKGKLTAQCVRQHNTNLRRVYCLPEARGKERDAEDENVAEEVEAHTQPPLDGDGHVVRLIFHIETVLCGMDEPRLFAVGSHGAQTRQSFWGSGGVSA